MPASALTLVHSPLSFFCFLFLSHPLFICLPPQYLSLSPYFSLPPATSLFPSSSIFLLPFPMFPSFNLTLFLLRPPPQYLSVFPYLSLPLATSLFPFSISHILFSLTPLLSLSQILFFSPLNSLSLKFFFSLLNSLSHSLKFSLSLSQILFSLS